MSKKKKRKTRKEKEKARLRREKYLDKYSKIMSNKTTIGDLPPQNIKKSQIVRPPQKFELSTEIQAESQYTISDTKKSLLIAFIFFALLVILYFLEQKFSYFGPLTNKLISILTRGF